MSENTTANPFDHVTTPVEETTLEEILEETTFEETVAETTYPPLEWKPEGFVSETPKMGIGMLSIFIVIGIIIGATYLVNFAFKPRNKTPKN